MTSAYNHPLGQAQHLMSGETIHLKATNDMDATRAGGTSVMYKTPKSLVDSPNLNLLANMHPSNHADPVL